MTHFGRYDRNPGTRVYIQNLFFIKTIKKTYIYLQVTKKKLYLHRVNFKEETGRS